MLESYITPVLMSYVDKYIKNLKPSDLSLSLWGGDVVLYNLELRLDVLEKELHLPITFLSGKIHKLQIHIPWTKLGSEPVEITISTLECVVQLKYPDHSPSDQSSKASEAASANSDNEKEELEKVMEGKEEVPPSGYVQSLINRVINNVSICVNNVILKYLEDDIVLSLNIKSAETFSVNSNWEKAFVDVVAPDFLLQKVCNISDLTICLDKRNSSGKIELYQDPLLYKCGLRCRMMLKFDSLLRPIETKFNVYCESADISLTDQQLPMVIRLATLCLSLYVGTLDLPGSEYKPHPAKKIVEQQAISNPNLSFTSEPQEVSTQTGNQQNPNDEDWVNWVWSFVPNLTDDQSALLATPPPTPLLLAGFYVSHVTITIKLTGKVSDGNFFGGQRFEFKPMLSFELSGGAAEMVLRGDEFFDAQVGVSSIIGWNIGNCVCRSLDVSSTKEGIEADDKEDVFITIASHKEDSSDSLGFLTGSLFDNGERSSLAIPDLTFDAEEFLKIHNEKLALRRYGAFFADYLYTMEIEPESDQDAGENQLEGLEIFGEIRLVKEMSFKRLIVGPTHLQLSTSMMHRLELVLKLAFDDIVPRKEKCELYYDEFIEKQLLAGNIPARNSSITLVSFTATLPAADHGKMSQGPLLQHTNSSTELHTVSSQLSLQSIPDVEDTDIVPEVVCIVQISRIDVQVTEPMYPTELTKLTVANAEYPAGKAMLMCTYSDVSAQLFGIQVSVTQLHSDVIDMPMVNIIPAFSVAGSLRFCILPESWGGADLLKKEAHIEVPDFQTILTKPQFVLMSHIADSWASSMTKEGKMAPIPRAIVGCVFYPNDQDSGGIQPELQFKVSNIQVQFCETQSVVGASGSVGSVFASLKSCTSGTTETTPLVKGPSDTSEMYTGNLFRSAHLQENFVESTGPVLTFTVQLPQAAIRSGDPVAQPVPPSGDQLSGLVLFHLKGITASLDPLLYKWICYKSPAPKVTPRHKAERERTKITRQQSLPKTPSATTPRKKSFARGYGSVASPAKEEKAGSKQEESPQKQSPLNESSHEVVDGRKMFENWLFDKLSFLTAMELQVHMKSAVLFLPEKHIAHEFETNDIASTFSTQSLKTTNNSFPPTLVICLPSFKLLSANHEPMSVRQSLPVKRHHKDATRRETLPWTLEAENLAVYSVYVKKSSLLNGGDFQPVVHYLLSKVSSTAVLASARTSSVPSSSPLAPLQFLKPSSASGRRVSMLGFCVHTDFQPIEVSCCGKQMQLVANLLEGVLTTCFSTPTSSSSSSADTTSGMPTSVTHPIAPAMKRTTSLASSSFQDQVESEMAPTETVSSTTFSQVQQPSNAIRVSLWLQWTLPRVVANLYSRSAVDHSAVCVSAELEDLTASVDFSDTILQMQCKIGAFNISHFTHSSDGFWELGHFNGILLSCNDIISSKSLFTSARRPSSGRRENPGPGAHGFLTIMYKRSSLHLKRRRSSSVERTGKEEDQYKDQHEVHVNIQPFDVVLWCPAIVSALNTFDVSLLEKFRYLSEDKNDAEKTENMFIPKNDEEAEKAESLTVNVELLPLLFVNMRNLRLFIPGLFAGKDPNSAQESGRIHSQEDMAVVQLSTVAVSPHPDNPNSRKVLNHKFYEKFRKFGRGSRQALGYDIHDVQYQIDLCGFGVWTGSWEQLCGKHKHEDDQELVGIAVDQNPALEWNTQMWRGTEEVRVTQIISGSDFRVVLAPAISVEKYVAVDRSTVSERIQVCGWSLEFNVVTDVDCFLNKEQIQLLQTLSAENLKTLSNSLSVPLNESAKASSDPSVVRGPDDVFLQSVDRIDSGFESTRSNLSPNFRKDRSGISKFPVEKGSCNTYKPPEKQSEVPWEVFLTGRKLSAAVYSQFLLEDKFEDRVFASKQSMPGRGKSIQIKPVLRVELVHPALIVNTQSSDPRIQVSCFDISITGPSTEKVFKPLPDPADYTEDWLKSGAGLPDPHSGILPSLVTVDITDFLCGKADVFVELGRSLHLNLNLEMAEEMTEFLDGLVVLKEEHLGAKGTQMRASGRTSPLRSFCLNTSEIFIHMEAPPIPGKPKLLGSLLGIESKICLKLDEQGNLKRADTRLQLHGVGLSTSVYDRCRSLIHPFSCSVDLEMVWEPHSRDLCLQSGRGIPQLYAVIEAGFVQVDVGQEHVACLSVLADLAKQFFSPATVNQEMEEHCVHKSDLTPVKPERVVLFESFDDIRAGCFRYVTASGEGEAHHPEPWEVVFTSEFSERPPAMTWRYPEPRALSAVDMVPLPLSTPVLVNTLNMGDEYQVPCVLRYWDPTQKCFITYKEFTLSENNATHIPLPDPSKAHPAEVIVAAEWQMVVDVTVDIEYPDDRSHDDDDFITTSYASPYRSLLSAASLAASVKVNSVVKPDLNPALSAQLNISMLQVKFTNHLHAIGRVIPQYLRQFTIDPFLPTDQEFLLLSVEGLSGVIKDVGGTGGFLQVQAEWNCHAQVLDYGDLTHRPLLSPFDVGLTVAMYHEGRTMPPKAEDRPTVPPVWIDASLEAGTILAHVSQSTIHTIALSATAWCQTGQSEAQRVIFNHYVICNDTNEALRFGQVDTDESLLLMSRHVHAYSWRTPHTVKACPRLHVCIETEGDWRWSEPFDIDTVGVFSRTIHHRLHSATLFIEVKQLSGMQKQVIIRGSHIIVSRLSIDVDVQILTNPSLNTEQSSKARYQVLEDVSLPANTTLPSYVISHGGLAGMRIRIPNDTTWSDALPLEYGEGESTGHHCIVQLLGVKDFQTFYFWYNLEKPGSPDQIKVTLSPLFVMRSHLPEPVLMNVFTANTNSASVLQLQGRAREQQMYSLIPNSWHHLTFQFTGSSKWSSPSVPLNTTLIELANRMNNNDDKEEDRPLADIWPYCENHQYFRRCDIISEEKPESSLVKNLSLGGDVNEDKTQLGTKIDAPSQDMRENPSSIPAIEVQCRVIKRWPHLSSLLVEVLPWCLLVNNIAVHVIIRDLERDVDIDLPSGSVVAPHRITGKVKFGAYFGNKDGSWSEAVSLPSDSPSTREASSNDVDEGLSVPIAFVLSSGDIRGARWTITSRMCRGIKIVSVEQRFQMINNFGKPLVVHPVLVTSGKKIPVDNLTRATAVSLSSDPKQFMPITSWDVPSSTAVVVNEEGESSFSGQTSPVLFLAFEKEPQSSTSEVKNLKWSRAVLVTPEVTRQSVAVSVDDSATLPVVVTSHVANGIVNIVVSPDPSPRLLLQNDCPFTLQFGQAIPPQSPNHVSDSPEKIVVVEQMQGLGEIPAIVAFSSTYYELPVMREWFATSSEVQRLPELHIQALYDVNVAEISEEEGERGELAAEMTTEVPQGWSNGFDLNSLREVCVNLPGRGQVLLTVTQERLCTCVKVQPLEKDRARDNTVQSVSPVSPVIHADLFICQVGVTIMDEVTNFRNPYEVFRITAEGVSVKHSAEETLRDRSHDFRDLSLCVGAVQVDNQLQDDMYEFSVILTPSNAPMTIKRVPSQRRPGHRSRAKPLVSIKIVYEPGPSAEDIFLSSVCVTLQPLTMYIEDTFLYRLGDMAVSFLPPLLYHSSTSVSHLEGDRHKILNAACSNVRPILMGELKITPVTFSVTLHGSAKLFLSVDDSPLSLGQFHMSPVYLPSSALVQKLTYHYVTAALFKAGWVLGSLELLGNPAGLVRSFSQGVADFFYLPYDGLTRGPGAFVSGMSRGMSSFVRHLSTGALTSITSLASSMARNLDRLSMDREYLRLLEEQRCRRPKKVLTGLSKGLGGFGLSLLGAVAGIVDQPIQGIRQANDVREAASGVITGVGKGLIGVVTKPLGGAMELVSQTGQGILQGAGLTELPNRLFDPGERLAFSAKNSHLKYFWKMLHNQEDLDLLLHLEATVVTSSGHDYDGTVLLTRDTLFIVGQAADTIQQTLFIKDIDLQEDEEDNRSVAVVNQVVIAKDESEEADGVHDSGDPDRLRQFLKDARAQALEQMATLDSSDSNLTSPGQKFVLLVDPMLRRTLLLQFQSAKRNLISDP